eukprot:scaffold190363_cov18-Tisochrysis_lutea.AAC.1
MGNEYPVVQESLPQKDPRWPDVKALQAALLCQQLAPWAQGPQPVPIVLGGDFNSLWRKYKPDAFDA